MAPSLRDATIDDRLTCAKLLALLQGAISASDGTTTLSGFDHMVDKSRGQIVLAEEDGVVLGMATVSYNVALRYAGEYCQLEELIVTEQARGKNVGGLLMQRVIENATSRGCAEMGLYLVEHTEHNRPFYAKYGFEVIGTEMRRRLDE